MSVTAKQLAAELGISATAVSMALNNKPGVSTETRQNIIRYAEERGYDFTRLKHSANQHHGSIQIIMYKTHDAILSYSPIFNELYEGIKEEAQAAGFSVNMIQFYEKTDTLDRCFEDIRGTDCAGIILVGTEIRKETAQRFIALGYPFVLLDTYFDSLDCTSVVINNSQGAYIATDYLISMTHTQPGYLQSSYEIPNFTDRHAGYVKAIRENGMSSSRSIIHKLSPSIADAMADMLEIIDRGDPLAHCYFADNDMIAIGAMRAFKLRGYKVPEDVAFIGFDNISESRIVEPALTTMDVPRIYIGHTAGELLIKQIDKRIYHASKVEISTRLIKRLSHCSV